MTLAEARAIFPALQTEQADPDGDLRALEQLARWAIRYSPLVSIDGTDGIFIDASGCAHLFGGETAMLDDIKKRLTKAGVSASLAMADTPGAAWALSHHQKTANSITLSGHDMDALSALPVHALRLDEATVVTLARLGLKKIGALTSLDRPALARRFRGAKAQLVSHLLCRLDQASGRRPEPIDPLLPLPSWQVRQAFMEPVLDYAILEKAVSDLVDDLTVILQEAEQGVRRLALAAYRVDGTVAHCHIGTSRSTRDAAHLLKLLAEKLPNLDAGFGIDLILLSAFETERLAPSQIGDQRQAEMKSAAELMDRLSARLGPQAVTRLRHRPSHIPERAQILVGSTEERLDWEQFLPQKHTPRPIRLLSRPEVIEVLAEVPEGPPKSFRWRRVNYRVVTAEGPERIATEWWQSSDALTRDYYRIEDEAGYRFWLFRLGLYAVHRVRPSETDRPAWYMHGLFC